MSVPDAATVAAKWKDVTPERATFYETNAPAAAEDWEAETLAAKGNFKAAVSDPKIGDKFAGGVKGKAGKFRRKITDVGVDRFGPGVEAAEQDMSAGIAPFLAKIAATTISDRKPRGTASNYNIVKEVGDPLHKLRLAILGAGS